MTPATQRALIVLAEDAGYVAYRVVPEARPYLSGVCLLVGESDPLLVQERFRELIGRVWEEANSTDAAMVILSLNNLMGVVALKDEAGQVAEGTKEAIQGICRGVDLAQRSRK